MNAREQMILEEYLDKRPTFEKMRDIAVGEIKRIIKSNNIYVVSVESRIKTEKSLTGKLELKGYKYQSLSDITDILGCRVIAFYSDEVDKISALIEKAFEVDWDESVDKRKIYSGENADKFGYMSLHYICRIPKSVYYNEQYPEVNEFRFEIQMRTALQHVWATAAHDTGYKSDIEIPAKYLRQISRLAGLLEIADESFTNLISEITEYRRKVSDLVKNGSFADLTLDGDTFASYMNIKPFDELNKKIAGINKAEIAEDNPSVFFQIFKQFGFKTIEDIEHFRQEYSSMAYQLALEQLAETDLDIISSNIGIQNCCLCFVYKNGVGLPGLTYVFDTLYGKKDRNLKSAKRVFDQLEKIRVI